MTLPDLDDCEDFYCLLCHEPCSALSLLVGRHTNHPRRRLDEAYETAPSDLQRELHEFQLCVAAFQRGVEESEKAFNDRVADIRDALHQVDSECERLEYRRASLLDALLGAQDACAREGEADQRRLEELRSAGKGLLRATEEWAERFHQQNVRSATGRCPAVLDVARAVQELDEIRASLKRVLVGMTHPTTVRQFAAKDMAFRPHRVAVSRSHRDKDALHKNAIHRTAATSNAAVDSENEATPRARATAPPVAPGSRQLRPTGPLDRDVLPAERSSRPCYSNANDNAVRTPPRDCGALCRDPQENGVGYSRPIRTPPPPIQREPTEFSRVPVTGAMPDSSRSVSSGSTGSGRMSTVEGRATLLRQYYHLRSCLQDAIDTNQPAALVQTFVRAIRQLRHEARSSGADATVDHAAAGDPEFAMLFGDV